MFKMCDFWMYSVNLGVLIRKGVSGKTLHSVFSFIAQGFISRSGHRK